MVVAGGFDLDIRLSEDYEEVPLPRGLQFITHVEIGVHPGLQDRDLPELPEFGGSGVVGKSAGHDHIESGIGGLPGSADQVLPRHRAELRADEDAGAALALALGVAALGGDVLAGQGSLISTACDCN